MNKTKIQQFGRPLLGIIMLILAIVALVQIWNYYTVEPWTRDGRVRGDIIHVSSDVSGIVTEVLVQDNQTVKKGQVLFKIDVARKHLEVEQARSDLLKANAELASAEAELAQAEANLIKSKASTKLAEKNAVRYASLMDGAISKQEQDQMFAARDQAQAEHIQLEAMITQAHANIKQQKALIEVAQSQVNLAQLNLTRSEVVAPSDGTLSNFELQEGSYITTGQAVAALIDREKLYVVGYFEETKLDQIYVGAPVTVELMGDSQKLKGHVQGMASGIEDRERSPSSGLLANVNPTFSWVRLAQRVPVKIILDELPKNELSFVAGRTATIHIEKAK